MRSTLARTATLNEVGLLPYEVLSPSRSTGREGLMFTSRPWRDRSGHPPTWTPLTGPPLYAARLNTKNLSNHVTGEAGLAPAICPAPRGRHPSGEESDYLSPEASSSSHDGFFYQFAPYLLMLGGVVLGTITYVTHSLLSASYNQPVWIVVAFAQGVAGYWLGRLVLRLRRAARVDSLTGIYNRRHFHEMLTREIVQAQRLKGPISLLLVDVDHFKTVNDSYGHIAGDEVLKKIADLLRNNTRRVDTVARWGGEEFSVVLPHTGRDGAIRCAERLRACIESSFEAYQVTISIGVAYAHRRLSMDDLIDKADTALYSAKQNRNSVSAIEAD